MTEKEAMWFVWEQGPSAVYPAKYAEKPMTGMGSEQDRKRWLIMEKLPDDQRNLSIEELVKRYPKPKTV